MRRPVSVTVIAMICAVACGGEPPNDVPRASGRQKATFTGTTLQATAATSEIDLAWPQSSTQVSGWQVYRSTSATGIYALIASLPATATTYGDVGLSTSSTYCYRVRSWLTTRNGTSYSAYNGPACATTLAPPTPAAPSNTNAVGVSDTRIDVGWQDNSSNETGFEIHRSTSGSTGTFSLLASTAAGAVAWSDTRLAPSAQYCYRIRAFNTSGGKTSYSDFSGAGCATTLASPPPAAPTNALVYPTAAGGMAIYWQDNSDSESGFEIHRSLDGPGGSFVLLSSTAPNVTSANDPGLAPLTQYCYKVRAFTNAVGYSGFSNTACASTRASLLITANTTGEDVPASGYAAVISKDYGNSSVYVTVVDLPVNGTGRVPDLDPATDYVVKVVGVALNCDFTSPNPQHVHVGSEPAVTVEFDVKCAQPTQLAFATTGGETADIAVINVDGTGAAALTAEPGWDTDPAWSPDGTKIAFTSTRGGTLEIYIMNADGSNPIQLTSIGGGAPAWSPDGTKIAFTCGRDGNSEVCVVNVDGTGLVNLTNDPADDGDPTWSPDGSKIAFRSDRDGSGYTGIYVMNADGSGATRLTTDAGVADSQPAWSPDGSRLAISRYLPGEWSQTIWLMSPVDGSAGALSARNYARPDCEWHSDPAWSSDGKKISFTNSDWCADGTTINVLRLGADDYTGGMPVTAGSEASWRPSAPAR